MCVIWSFEDMLSFMQNARQTTRYLVWVFRQNWLQEKYEISINNVMEQNVAT